MNDIELQDFNKGQPLFDIKTPLLSSSTNFEKPVYKPVSNENFNSR
jgi:hypothetical protein